MGGVTESETQCFIHGAYSWWKRQRSRPDFVRLKGEALDALAALRSQGSGRVFWKK